MCFNFSYVQDLNDLVTYICLIEFLSFGLMLCALLFLLNIVIFYFRPTSKAAFTVCFPVSRSV